MLFAMRSSVLRRATTHLYPSNTLRLAKQSVLFRFLSSLAVLEQREGKLQGSSLSSVSAAQKLGGPITAMVAGSGIIPVAEEAAKVKGVEKVIMIENGAYDKVCFCCNDWRLRDD